MKNNLILREYISNTIRKHLNEQSLSNKGFVRFEEFPSDVLKTLEDEYGHFYQNNFDWNSKQDEFIANGEFDGKAFANWLNSNKSEEFLKNIDKLIQKTREDLILLIKRRNSTRVLKDFEELIIPTLGSEVLVQPLSKYMEFALLNLHNTKSLNQAFKDAKNIINSDGSLDQSKITPSNLFVGDQISLPRFEEFVNKRTEYLGVFNDWKKMFDKDIELSTKDLNAFRSSTPYEKIRNLYDFLIDFKKNINETKFSKEHLNESAEKDIFHNKEAVRIYNKIKRNINKITLTPTPNDNEKDTIKDSRGNIHTLNGVKFNLKEINEDYDLDILLANSLGRGSEHHFDPKENRLVFFIITQAQDPLDFEYNSYMARLRFKSWVEENVFVHEFIHFLDSNRYSDSYVFKNPKNHSDYFNSPEEFNSYTHEIINKILKNKKGMIGLSFNKFLIKSLSFGNQQFIKSLNDTYLKKLKNRLYSLFVEINSESN